MQIIHNIIADHTALWFEKAKILSFADLHLGYEDELFRKGVHIPTNEFAYQRNLIGSLIKKYKPKTVILNGDIKHGFAGINDKEWRHAIQLFDLITPHADLIIIKGNHDVIIEPLARKRGIIVVDNYVCENILFIHGDVIPTDEQLKATNIVVIGHEHPAISLTNGVRSEQYKCFLKLPWNKRTLIVQPSTFSLTIGSDIRKELILNPLLKQLKQADVYAVGENAVLYFGALSDL